MIKISRYFVIIIGAAICLLYWFFEALIHNIVYGYSHNIFEHIIYLSSAELTPRVLFMTIILINCIILQYYINRLKSTQENLNDTYDQLEVLNNIFIHDLSNIFQVIHTSVSYLHQFSKGENINIKNDELVEMILKQDIKAKMLISNMVSFTKLKFAPILNSIDIQNLLYDSTNFIKNNLLDKSIKIELPHIDDNLYVKANDLLTNVFENVLYNAVKHNKNDQIEIDINISKENIDKVIYLKIEFKDNGIGIPDEQKKKIFQETKFIRDRSNGMGFGLSLIKKVLSYYKGYIKVEDKIPGKYSEGSNFIVYLPEEI
ncbi:MAG: HAMP domain-containing histidine kinase [Candidatus Lokiarchaeota archaeon]|nr:HAMP domain-containing histidine kinase [Candidatus Lokiarchaeota archaeon]